MHAVKAHVEYTNDVRLNMFLCRLYIHHHYSILFILSTPSSLPHQAISGQAVNRHLNGLKLIAAEVGMETPALFKDVAYTRSVSHTLITSNVRIVVKVVNK